MHCVNIKPGYTYPQRVPRADIMHAYCDCWVRSHSRVARLERWPVQDSILPRALGQLHWGYILCALDSDSNPMRTSARNCLEPVLCVAMRMRISVTDIYTYTPSESLVRNHEPRAKALGNELWHVAGIVYLLCTIFV